MPRISVPKDLGECEIVVARAGNYAVWNRKTGKNKFWVACRDLAHAEAILRKLKEKDHGGELWV